MFPSRSDKQLARVSPTAPNLSRGVENSPESGNERQWAMLSFGFPPVSSPVARVLVLGSLPGRLSLERGEYYANPRNAFWKIAAARIPRLPADYVGRTAALIGHRVALWDVLAAATRSGSLDADIGEDAIPNNFRAFFHIHPHIRLVCFNGATPAKLYERHVMPTLSDAQRAIERKTLPSTSGAHANLPFAQKVSRWSPVFGEVVVKAADTRVITDDKDL